MEQIEGPMNTVTPSSVHVNSYGGRRGAGGGQAFTPPRHFPSLRKNTTIFPNSTGTSTSHK